jgi:hypothetical protein
MNGVTPEEFYEEHDENSADSGLLIPLYNFFEKSLCTKNRGAIRPQM